MGTTLTPPTRPRRKPARRRHPARRVWREHAALILITAVFCIGSAILGPLVGWQGTAGQIESWMWLYQIIWAVMIAAVPFILLARRFQLNRESPALPAAVAWRLVLRRLARREFSRTRLAGLLVVWIAAPACMATFLAWKASIPRLQPYVWDVPLIRLEAVLHGGRQPWEWLAPLLAEPALVRAIDFLYGPVWLLTIPVLPFVVAWLPFSPLRRRFLVAFLLMWVLLGTVAAISLASAGPAYVAMVAPEHAHLFEDLMAQLHAMHAERPLVAVRAQAELLEHIALGGISAMPSLHIASGTLVAIAAWRVRPWVGVIATLYAAALLVGSVLLGWHYAVDGYVGAAGAWVVWWVAGRGTRRRTTPRHG